MEQFYITKKDYIDSIIENGVSHNHDNKSMIEIFYGDLSPSLCKEVMQNINMYEDKDNIIVSLCILNPMLTLVGNSFCHGILIDNHYRNGIKKEYIKCIYTYSEFYNKIKKWLK